MDLTTASPAEIDTQIARLDAAMNAALATVQSAADAIDRIRSSRYYRPDQDDTQIADHEATIATANAAIDAAAAELAPLRAEFARRNGWPRYYLVDAHNGHVHDSMRCSTCFPTTAYYWLTSESGKTAEQVVHQAQAQACTVCFPWAPVTTRPGSYRTPTQREREARAAAREAKAAARRAKEITNPDGSPLQINRFGWQTIKTVRTAEIEVVDILFYAALDQRPLNAEEATALDTLLTALAAKKGVTVNDERAAAHTRLTAKRRREGV